MARVLLVEDDAAIAEAVRHALEAEGYEVAQAWNGLEALEILTAQTRPHLLLLDLMMPVMTGWQLMEELAQDTRLAAIPIVVTSAASSAEEHPCRDFLKKPYTLGELITVVEKHAAAAGVLPRALAG